MTVDKVKLKEPKNTEKHRERLAEIIVNDMTYKEIRQRVKDQLMDSYRVSTRHFLKEYWNYLDETYGHCPFGINGD